MSYRTIIDGEGDLSLSAVAGFVKTTSSGGARSSVYELAYAKTQTGASSAQAKWNPPLDSRERAIPQAKADHLRRLLLRACQKATSLAEAPDSISKANAAYNVRDALSALWEYRNEREPDWGDLLNVLQTILAAQKAEVLSSEKCQAILSVIRDRLAGVPVERDDVSNALRTLMTAGFDPWIGISQTAEMERGQ